MHKAAFLWSIAVVGLAVAATTGGDTVDHVDFPGDPDGSVSGSDGNGGGVPPGIDATAPTPEGGPPQCVPDQARDCAGKCGTIVGHCSEILDCGGCPSPQTCGGGGAANV